VHRLLHFGMICEQPQGETKGIGGRLVSGEQQGETFIAHLAVGHLPGVFFRIDGIDEHGEQIAAVAWIGAPALDHAVDHGGELGLAAADAAYEWKRKAKDLIGKRQERERKEAHECVDSRRDPFHLAFHGSVEEALAYDAQGEQQHVGMDVSGAPVIPLPRHREREASNDLSIASDAIAVKGGLREPPLPHVEWFLAGEHAISQDEARTLHHDATVVFRRIPDQHLVDEIRMVALKYIAPSRTKMNEIAKASRIADHEGGRVSAEEQA
jgi:hypothetical protein